MEEATSFVEVGAKTERRRRRRRRRHRRQHEAEEESETESESQESSSGEGEGEGEFGACKTCVFVLERIKKGTNMLLPAICSEIYTRYPKAYATCHEVLNSLS